MDNYFTLFTRIHKIFFTKIHVSSQKPSPHTACFSCWVSTMCVPLLHYNKHHLIRTTTTAAVLEDKSTPSEQPEPFTLWSVCSVAVTTHTHCIQILHSSLGLHQLSHVCVSVLEHECHTRHRDCPGRLLGIPRGSKLAALPDGLVWNGMPGIHRNPDRIRHSSSLSCQDVWEIFPSRTALRTERRWI